MAANLDKLRRDYVADPESDQAFVAYVLALHRSGDWDALLDLFYRAEGCHGDWERYDTFKRIRAEDLGARLERRYCFDCRVGVVSAFCGIEIVEASQKGLHVVVEPSTLKAFIEQLCQWAKLGEFFHIWPPVFARVGKHSARPAKQRVIYCENCWRKSRRLPLKISSPCFDCKHCQSIVFAATQPFRLDPSDCPDCGLVLYQGP